MTNEIQENDIVLCTVKRIERTTVFLDLDDYPGTQGTMIFSEISPGRIRNIREYVVPNKKIVCKILRIKEGHPELSLRRVSAGERNEVLDRHKKARTLQSILKPILKDKTLPTLEKIKEKYDLADFLDEAREDAKILKKFLSPKQAEELEKVFSQTKDTKEKEIKVTLTLTTQTSSGLEDIKEVLSQKNVDIRYLGSSKFSITIKAKDYKTANSKLEEVLEEIKEKAKKRKVNLTISESKK